MRRSLFVLSAWAVCMVPNAFAFQETPHFAAEKPSLKVLEISEKAPAGATAEETAWTYVRENWQELGLQKNAANLVISEVKHSLRGAHVHFYQAINGVPIERTGLVVSLNNDNHPYRVRKALFDKELAITNRAKAMLDRDDALDVAWNNLGVSGSLRALPEAKQVIVVKDGLVRLSHRVTLAVDEPYGTWSVLVDSLNGEILEIKDRIVWERQPERKAEFDSSFLSDRELQTKFYKDRVALEKANQNRKKLASKRATGRGLVFDPDPRTTLMDDSIEDFSPDSVFDPAYFERDLLDITQDGDGNFILDGPWVQIRALTTQFTAPNTPPSTTTDGNWNFKRGNNAFNDAMTYYQVDKNQRYLQSLGYTGNRGIQFGPINADTDGWNGADNSFFDPAPNAIVFGHGCVDDNEDADVIIHEYGHAMHQSMIPGFSFDQDEGAIGEGFGDYWAVTYSWKTLNGLLFNPNWMFSWDGHNQCWGGRVTDATGAQYNPNAFYGAHTFIGQGNIQSDELWSTPLASSSMEVYQQGLPLEQGDTIVVEGHFGTIRPINIAELAQATVDAARDLYPDGPHGDIFQQYFARHNMMDPLDRFEYIAPHVPPAATAADWISEMVFSNAGNAGANVTITTYESGADGFTAIDEQTVQVAAGAVSTFTPSGNAQRWVRFVSDQPLAGTFSFRREPGDERGAEQAILPLVTDYETSTELILPHVPADRASFWSGAVVLNPTDQTLTYNVQLIGEDGNDLSHLLNDSVPTSLAPFQKGVTFLAPGPGGAAGMFDDSASQEKVSWVRLTASGQIAAFQLYGYNGGTTELATTGIIATPNQVRSVWPTRVNLDQVDWNGFSVLNPSADTTTLTVTVYGDNEAVLAQGDVVLAANSKALGLNTAAGFNFPAGTPAVSFGDGSAVRMVTIESNAPLRIFGLTGDNGNTTLDGTAVSGLQTRTVYNNPTGTFEIFKTMIPGDVVVRTRLNDDSVQETTFSMEQGETRLVNADANAASIEIVGQFVTSTLVNRDNDSRTLTVQPGTQVVIQP